MSVPSQESERSCICVLEVMYLCVRVIKFVFLTILLFHFDAVSTVWGVFFGLKMGNLKNTFNITYNQSIYTEAAIVRIYSKNGLWNKLQMLIQTPEVKNFFLIVNIYYLFLGIPKISNLDSGWNEGGTVKKQIHKCIYFTVGIINRQYSSVGQMHVSRTLQNWNLGKSIMYTRFYRLALFIFK